MEYVRIGTVAKPQGIRGELKINSLSDTLSRFLDLEYVFVEDKGNHIRYNVKGARLGDDCAFLFLEHIYTRDEAEALRNKYICVDRAHAIKLPEGRYFIFDLEGCTVYTDDGRELGVLKEVLQPGANDVYVVQGEKGEILIPAVKAFIKETDIEHKRVVVFGSMLEEVSLGDEN